MNRLLFALIILFAPSLSVAQTPPQGIQSLQNVVTTKVFKDGHSTVTILDVEKTLSSEAASRASNYTIVAGDESATVTLLRVEVKNGENEFKSDAKPKKSIITQEGLGLTKIATYVIPLRHVMPDSVITVEYEITQPPQLPGVFSAIAAIANNSFADVEEQRIDSEIPLSNFKG